MGNKNHLKNINNKNFAHFMRGLRQRFLQYVGEYFKDHRSGYGRIEYSDGSLYLGRFQNGFKHENGDYINADGIVEKQKWILGHRII